MSKIIESGITSFRLRALLALLLVSSFLVFAVYKNETARAGGAEIVLETRPIDPRDIFFGHYAILSYDLRRITSVQAFDLMDEAFRAEAKRVFEVGGERSVYRYDKRLAPAYLVLKRDGDFHTADYATLDLAKAQASGAKFIKSWWSVSRMQYAKECEHGQTQGIDCEWGTSVIPKLPGRYYADKKTALALQSRQGEAQRIAAQQQRFEDCERRRAEISEGDPVPSRCEDVTAPVEEAEKFGVVLSISDHGEAVIKGIVYGDQKVLDSLNGPRLTEQQLK